MFAIRHNGTILTDRYETEAEAIEAAQETHKLPPDADWQIVSV